jgi:hypothetical protein
MRATMLALVFVTAGCGGRARLWNQPLAVSGPYKLSSQVVWLDASRGLAIAVEPGPAEPALRASSLRRNATFAAPAPDGERLLVLTAGQEAVYKDQHAEEPGLSVLRVVPGRAPEVALFYPLSAAFDRLAISPDGTLAVAYYGSTQGSGGLFRNPNEVALLDLTRPAAADNPTLRTVRSFGSAPIGVVFSPGMPVPAPSGASRTLALVLAKNAVTFLDLTHPGRREITVPLAKPDSSAELTPQQVEFSPATGTVFVRASGAADLYSLALLAQASTGTTDNDFLPSINQPSSGKTPLDMVLFSDGGKDLILTANASQDLSLIDAATSQFSIIPVGTAVDTLLAVPAGSPKLVIAYSAGHPSADIHFVELAGLATGLDKNLTHRKLEKPVRQLVATPGGDQALVVHDDKRTVVSVLDLVGPYHTVAPIQGQLPLQSFDFAQRRGAPMGSFLVGVTSGLKQLGLLDLGNLHPTLMRLDQNPHSVVAVGGALVVDHGDPTGVVTVVPDPGADRDASRTLSGIFLDGLVGRELTD